MEFKKAVSHAEIELNDRIDLHLHKMQYLTNTNSMKRTLNSELYIPMYNVNIIHVI